MKNKFKIVAFFLAIICVGTIAYGCGKSDSNTEITDSTPITMITASATQASFIFEKVYSDGINGLVIYQEKTTDTLFLELDGYNSGGIAQMLDPETGKPLTYSVWLEKYAK